MITLFGATGSGKSEQGKLLAHKYRWSWVSSRDLLQNLHDRDVNLALRNGMYIDDKIMNRVMMDAIQRTRGARNVVLDGFPSDLRQVRWLIDHGEIQNLTGAIILRVPHGELWRRLVNRKRVDDTRAAIERRNELYDRAITGMIRALSQEGVEIREVDGLGTPQDVLERIEEVLGEWGLVPRRQFEKNPSHKSNVIDY